MATTAHPLSDAFFDCPHGVAPGRMPKADATELAPKKSAIPSGTLFCGVPEGFCFLVKVFKSQPISLVRLPSGGLGLQNAKVARLLLPGAPNPAFLVPPAAGIPPLPIRASILSHPASSADSFCAPRRQESEKPAGDYRENVGGNDCDALHPRQLKPYLEPGVDS